MTRRLLALAAVLALTGCSLDKQAAPPLTGPSELGLSLAVTATPDIITQDGQSQATIQVTARDSASQPVSGLSVRADIYANGQLVDFGTLSSKTASTDSGGHATIVYRAPAAPSPLAPDSTLVTIAVTPVGTNSPDSNVADYAASVTRTVDLKVVRPGTINPPGAAPTASFIVSPTAPREDDDVFFDASSSTGTITAYAWSWGDGRNDSSSSPTARHHFDLAGTYKVTLTVTDTLGRTATTAATSVTVSPLTAATQLVADMVVSPGSPKPGDLVFFDASPSTTTPGHSIAQYSFNFGDGSPIVAGSSPYANHAYGTAGSYQVVLQVTDDTGRSVSKGFPITVVVPGP